MMFGNVFIGMIIASGILNDVIASLNVSVAEAG